MEEYRTFQLKLKDLTVLKENLKKSQKIHNEAKENLKLMEKILRDAMINKNISSKLLQRLLGNLEKLRKKEEKTGKEVDDLHSKIEILSEEALKKVMRKM